MRRGDSAWAIARRTGVSQQAVLKANGLRERSVLRPGQELVLPDSPRADRSAVPERTRAAAHVVRKGESLGAIARRYHISVGALARANGIANVHRIRAGRKLVLPTAEASRARVASKARAVGQVESRERDLVDTALGYRGVPYRYAGTTSRGMDCSGLVYRVLAAHGIRAPHSSRALYALGQPVSRKDLQRGDLVFFHTRGRGISHVGIYIGEGKFVHASSSGRQVEVDRLDTGYYAQRFVGARRLS